MAQEQLGGFTFRRFEWYVRRFDAPSRLAIFGALRDELVDECWDSLEPRAQPQLGTWIADADQAHAVARDVERLWALDQPVIRIRDQRAAVAA